MNPTCLIVQPIHPVGLEQLKAAGLTPRLATRADMVTVAREMSDVTVVITRSAGLNAAAMDGAPSLRVIGSHGIGVDAIAVDHATALGIPVVNTPEANHASVAEHTVALILGVAKRLIAADAATRRVDFGFKYQNPLSDISGKTLGLVGFGGIGRRVAEVLADRGYRLALVDLREPVDLASELRARGADALALRADVADPDQVAALGGAVGERFAQVDVLVNNAGIALIQPADSGVICSTARRW